MTIDRPPRGIDIQNHLTAEKSCRKMSQNNVSVGDRRLLATKTIGCGTGVGPGALWADAERARRNSSDGTAASADRHHVDHWERQRPFADMPALREADLPIFDEADVRACTSNIDGDDIADAAGGCDIARADDAGRWSRECREHRSRPGCLAPRGAGIRVHQ